MMTITGLFLATAAGLNLGGMTVTGANLLTVVQFLWVVVIPTGYKWFNDMKAKIEKLSDDSIRHQGKIERLESDLKNMESDHKGRFEKMEGKLDTAIEVIQDVRIAIGRLEEKGK